jgi:hypothetical protein
MSGGAVASTSWVRCATDLPTPTFFLLNWEPFVERVTGYPLLVSFKLPACPRVLWFSSFTPPDLGFLALSTAIPFIQILTRMALKASRPKGKGADLDGDAAPASLPKGSWEGSWVKEKRIKLLRQGRVLPSADLVGCRPTGDELVPAP